MSLQTVQSLSAFHDLLEANKKAEACAIPFWGGRKFSIAHSNKLDRYALKKVIQRLQTLSIHLKGSEAQKLLDSVHRLRLLNANSLKKLKAANLFSRILTYMRQWLGNRGFDKERALCELEEKAKHGLLQFRASLKPFNLFDPPKHLSWEPGPTDDCFRGKAQLKWKMREVTSDAASAKMKANLKRAIYEHKKNPQDGYVSWDQYLQIPKQVPSTAPSLDYVISTKSKKGVRKQNEDFYFSIDSDDNILAGVFDGHGGRSVAKYACRQFRDKFDDYLSSANENVFQAFEKLIYDIDQKVERKKMESGTTAVVCYLDKVKRLVYTATIGDSEANLYPPSLPASIPLSCIRDWSSKNEAKRLAIAHGKWTYYSQNLNHPKPKSIYHRSKRDAGNDQYIEFCCNVSRSIGDCLGRNGKFGPAIIPKPKMTVAEYMPGCTITLSSDGVKDYLAESKIIDCIHEGRKQDPSFIAESLVERALEKSRDNVTVIAIQVVSVYTETT
jgi:serine/threonine protein phosphatase PrpC